MIYTFSQVKITTFLLNGVGTLKNLDTSALYRN